MDRTGDTGPGRGFFCDRDGSRLLRMGLDVQLPEKIHRLEVFAAAVCVRQPLPFIARVIEVQHRSDGIHTQSIDVIFLEPEQRTVQEKRAHLVASIVEDERAPIAVFPFSRVFMLVKGSAVKTGQTVCIFGEMSRHPVENDPKTIGVAGVDERLEIFGRPEPACRRKETDDLIAPRPRKRMFQHRQQFDVRITQVFDVGHQLLSQFAVGQRLAATLGYTLP